MSPTKARQDFESALANLRATELALDGSEAAFVLFHHAALDCRRKYDAWVQRRYDEHRGAALDAWRAR